MYKIMIVEDEKIERDHLVRVIESLKLPLQAVLTATNGEEGITIFNRYHPDIIIADINMPIMDGLTMIELVKRQSPDTVCFILSSYNYFTYAQKALRLGVIDFILKPSDRKAINDCLIKALEQLKLRENRKEQEKKLMAKMNDLNEEIVKNCFYSIMTYKDELQIQENLNLLGIKALCGVCFYIVGCDSLQMKEVAKIIADCGYDPIYHMLEQSIVLFALSNHTMDEQEIKKLQDVIEESLVNCECSVGRRADELYELIHSYEDARQQAQNETIKEQKMMNDDELKRLAVHFLDMLEINDKQGIDTVLYPILRQGDKLKYGSQLELMFEYTLLEVKKRYDIEPDHDFLKQCEIRDTKQLEMIVMEFCVMLQKVLKNVQYTRNQYNYKKACSFIEANYLKPITLLTVAEALHISPSYLSRLISKNGNDSFTDMVNALRIKEAKKQIKQGIAFKEVAHNVGFTSQSYFTKIFRKIVGMAPSEYKNLF
ncbi:MAG: response regulator [Erysipelotrichaceae bacterium]|nr:response regulator [Erysipelotrichaceae bacterium]